MAAEAETPEPVEEPQWRSFPEMKGAVDAGWRVSLIGRIQLAVCNLGASNVTHLNSLWIIFSLHLEAWARLQFYRQKSSRTKGEIG